MVHHRNVQSRRVVLIVARHEMGSAARLQGTLDEIDRLGWTIAGIVEPDRHHEALRMVLGGLADVVVATRSEHLPMMMLASDLRSVPSGRPAAA